MGVVGTSIMLNRICPRTNRATSGYTLIAASRMVLAASGSLLVTLMVIMLESEMACAEILPFTDSVPSS